MPTGSEPARAPFISPGMDAPAMIMDRKVIITLAAVVVAIAVVAAALLLGGGGDGRDGACEVTFALQQDPDHPDVSMTVFDTDGLEVDGPVGIEGDAGFTVVLVTWTEDIVGMGTDTDRAVVTGFRTMTNDEGMTMAIATVTVSHGDPVTVTVVPEYGVDGPHELTISVADVPGQPGFDILFEVDGEAIDGTYPIGDGGVEVSVTVVGSSMPTSIAVSSDPEGSAVVRDVVIDAGELTASAVIAVSGGRDVSVTVEVSFAGGGVASPSAHLALRAPEGVTVRLDGASYSDGDVIPLRGDAELTVDPGDLDGTVAYAIGWGGTYAEGRSPTEGTYVLGVTGVPSDGSVGTLRIGMVQEGASSPGYAVHITDAAGISVEYDVDGESLTDGEVLDSDRSLGVTMDTKGQSVVAVRFWVAAEDGYTGCVTLSGEGSVTGIMKGTVADIGWVHGDLWVSAVPVFADRGPGEDTIWVTHGEGVTVSVGDSPVGSGSIVGILQGSSLEMSIEGPCTVTYAIAWADGEVTGTVVAVTGMTLSVPLGAMAQGLGPAEMSFSVP